MSRSNPAVLANLVMMGSALVSASCGDRPPAVEVAPAARENISASINTNGKVEPVTPHVLRARLDTFVKKVSAAEGSAVSGGQVLLELDVASAQAALARAREELLAAQEDLRSAQAGGAPEELAQIESDIRKSDTELARLRRERESLTRLLAKQAATPNELDQNKLALERAEAQARLLQQKREDLDRRAKLDVERAALRLESARNDVGNFDAQSRSAQLASPVAGTLYALPVRAGDFVRKGDALAEVADLAQVRVRAFVDEPEMGALAAGQSVEITWDARPGRSWAGKTESVPRAVVQRGSRFVGEVLCSVDNARLELLPGTNVNVVIRMAERARALVVPRAAVALDGNRQIVFVAEGDTLRRREVKVGIRSATRAEVLEGLREGENVALPGEAELRDGLKVLIKR